MLVSNPTLVKKFRTPVFILRYARPMLKMMKTLTEKMMEPTRGKFQDLDWNQSLMLTMATTVE